MTLLLNPEHLGQVEIQFTGRDDQLSVVIQASGKEAEQALRDGVKELADGIVERTGRWQQVDIRIENKGADARRQDRGGDARRDGENESGRRDGQSSGGRQRQDTQEEAREWASAAMGE